VAEVDTRSAVPTDRFAYWLEAFSRAVVPLEICSDQIADFAASIRTLNLGVVQVVAHRYPCLEAHRTARLIRCDELGLYQLVLNLRGEVRALQNHRTVQLGAGEFTVLDCSRPFHAVHTLAPEATGQPEAITISIAHDLLPVPVDRADRVIASRMSGRDGVGMLLCQYLCGLVRHPQQYPPADLARLGTVTLDLIAATLARELDTDRAPDPDVVMLARVRAFVDCRISDPDLSPPMIAAAHHISTRTLHRLFHSCDTTVAQWIRSRRLERCRRDLADRLQSGRSIHAISAHWGFRDGTHFSRVFRAEYGMSPHAFRERQAAAGRDLTRIGDDMAPVGDDRPASREKR
jgi:AraC-like DNA-binding protein